MIDPTANKTVFIGRSGAGKTSLVNRLTLDIFAESVSSTIGAAYINYTRLIDNKEVKFHIWDTTGQERFNMMLPMFVRGAKVAIVCFDYPNLSDIEEYVNDIQTNNPSTRIYLVATKMDVGFPDKYSGIEEYAKKGLLELFYTSSLTGEGIDSLFDSVANYFIEHPPKETTVSVTEDKPTCCTLQ